VRKYGATYGFPLHPSHRFLCRPRGLDIGVVVTFGDYNHHLLCFLASVSTLGLLFPRLELLTVWHSGLPQRAPKSVHLVGRDDRSALHRRSNCAVNPFGVGAVSDSLLGLSPRACPTCFCGRSSTNVSPAHTRTCCLRFSFVHPVLVQLLIPPDNRSSNYFQSRTL